jgi:hypothetical protein
VFHTAMLLPFATPSDPSLYWVHVWGTCTGLWSPPQPTQPSICNSLSTQNIPPSKQSFAEAVLITHTFITHPKLPQM